MALPALHALCLEEPSLELGEAPVTATVGLQEDCSLSEDDCCAICLSVVEEPAQLACSHTFCLRCILRWVAQRSNAPCCALCKAPVGAYLQIARDLDGSPLPLAVEHPLVLLQRARWLTAAAVDASQSLSDEPSFEDEEEEHEHEARILRRAFGNRRFGSGGLLARGRLFARVVDPPRPPPQPRREAAKPPPGTSVGAGAGAAKSAIRDKRQAKAREAAEKEAAKRERRRRDRQSAPVLAGGGGGQDPGTQEQGECAAA